MVATDTWLSTSGVAWVETEGCCLLGLLLVQLVRSALHEVTQVTL